MTQQKFNTKEEAKITKKRLTEAFEQLGEEGQFLLETLFPEVFEEYKQKKQEILPFKVSDCSSTNSYIFIGRGLAPRGLENRCLILDNSFDWEIEEEQDSLYGEYKILIPTKKE